MPLSVGDKLGPYEIVAPLGAGGMGEVFRARDTKLKRDVAIKVLPEAFARDPDRMRRFQREAEVLASLNHPNIAHIYGVEERALIMELVEGETLPSGLPIDTVLRYALQIAQALEYAHDRGIMHRDLKPANIKVTPEGVVKLLDFGLAKAVEDPAASSVDPANSPTLTLGATRVGVILGTAAYMSPEQAGGKAADRRADIWSFGAVLYEMLTGKQAFAGESASDTLASVLKLDPDWKALPKATPASVSTLLRRCLTKDRRQRLQAIGEARILLEAPPESGTEVPRQVEERPANKLPWGIVTTTVAAGLALGLAALSFIHFREKSRTPELIRFEIPAPGGAALSNYLALSPDGRKLAFLATGKDSLQMVWIRSLDANEARPLPGTEGATNSFLVWSPDSRLVAFASGGQLRKIEVAGGPAQTVCAATSAEDGFWTPDNRIVYGTVGPIFQVSASGGTPTQLTASGSSRVEVIQVPGALLPDGRSFLYSRLTLGANENGGIYVGSLDAKPEQQSTKRLLSDGSSVRYVPSADAAPAPGFLLSVRGAEAPFLSGTLMAQPFDPKRLELSGAAVPIAEQVYFAQGFSTASNGKLAYRAITAQSQLTWADRSGKITATAAPPGIYDNIRLAPDDKRVAFDTLADVRVTDLVRGVPSRLTFGPTLNAGPIWSPDGLRVLYSSQRGGLFDLYIKSASGAGQEEVMVKLRALVSWATSWSRRYILYEMGNDKGLSELWIAPQFGDRKPFPYLQMPFNEQDGAFSPDGHWVAYASDETGRNEIYVQAFPLSGAKFPISAGGGIEPLWRKDGTELFYIAADRTLMAVPVNFTPTFDAGVPKPLFPVTSERSALNRRRYAVAGDGQRFLVATPAGAATQAALSAYQVVLNWTQMLKKGIVNLSRRETSFARGGRSFGSPLKRRSPFARPQRIATARIGSSRI